MPKITYKAKKTNRKLHHRSSVADRIKWKALADKDKGNSLYPAWQQSLDNFQIFLRTLRWNSSCFKQRYIHQLKAMDISGLEWWRVVRKKTPLWTQDVIEAIRATKDTFKACCKTGRHLICNPVFRGTISCSSDSKKCPNTL